ncbi:MAG: hypothetical protein AB7I45_01500 [Planctomycetota bacterium]
MTPQGAIQIALILCSVWHAHHALELLIARRLGHLAMLEIVNLRSPAENRIVGVTRTQAVFCALTWARLAAAANCLVAVAVGWDEWPAVPLLAASALYFAWVRQVGGDGAEEMALLVTLAILACTGPLSSPSTALAANYFIAGQCLLAYFVAGVAKLGSMTWLSGEALGLVTQTETYGHPAVNRLIRARPLVGRIATWSALLFEVTTPPAVLFSPSAAYVLVAVGAVFHVTCAYVMGLNGFLLAFASAYPSVLAASSNWHS